MNFRSKKTASSSLRQAGFTLIEMMITVAVIAILSTLAVPSYRDYVIRGKIPEATSNLAGKRVQMEQFFQDNRTYMGAPACNNDTATSQYFDFSCENLGRTTFLLKAVGKGDMAGFWFTLDQNNAKQTPVVPPGWTRSATCWVTRKDGSC
jgi:type IV pilus assembly protein PilE